MVQAFATNWKTLNILNTSTLLVAVSGGLDSVVLCHLLKANDMDFSIAHCNFQLRGDESTRDENFVTKLAASLGKKLYKTHFDTAQYATENKLSTQVAARQLRYNWFASLKDKNNNPFNFILTAHHADDNIETVLMNIFRGTGLSGLHGILPRQNNILRPLIFATRDAILSFAKEQQLQWVEDSSNASDKYTRNFIRHNIVPSIKEIFPQFGSNMQLNIERWKETETIYKTTIEQYKQKLCEAKGNEIHIPVLKLQQQQPLATIVYEIAAPYNFTAAQTPEIIKLLTAENGAYIASQTHRIIRNRNWLIIAPVQTLEAANILIEESDTSIAFEGGVLHLSKCVNANQVIESNPLSAMLDLKNISFPLLLRKCKTGDYFYPLGMKKKKKISKFFIDIKLSKTEKENVWVLESDKRILWVVGLRIDDRFKIQNSTEGYLQIQLSR